MAFPLALVMRAIAKAAEHQVKKKIADKHLNDLADNLSISDFDHTLTVDPTSSVFEQLKDTEGLLDLLLNNIIEDIYLKIDKARFATTVPISNLEAIWLNAEYEFQETNTILKEVIAPDISRFISKQELKKNIKKNISSDGKASLILTHDFFEAILEKTHATFDKKNANFEKNIDDYIKSIEKDFKAEEVGKIRKLKSLSQISVALQDTDIFDYSENKAIPIIQKFLQK